jgi:S1-C subfamily serine protease
MLAVRLLVAIFVVAVGCVPPGAAPPPAAPSPVAESPPGGAPVAESPPGTQSPTASDAHKNAMASSIALLDQGLTRVICSGQFVERDVIVTAHHCLDTATGIADGMQPFEGAPVAFVRYADWKPGTEMTARLGVVLVADQHHDLALILTATPSANHVELGSEPWLGATVFSIGHPDGEYFRTSAGIVTSTWFPIDSLYTATFIYIDHGSSGGGLYDSEWRLIGVASKGLGVSLGFFVPITYLRNLLESVRLQ